MTTRRTLLALLGSVLAALAAASPAHGAGPSRSTTGGYGPARHASCATSGPGQASCFAMVRYARHAVAPPAGSLTPADIASAYHLTGTGGEHAVIGIVDAFDDPNAVADLAVYRATFGLPACTIDSGCLRVVNQRGKTGSPPPPPPDDLAGWDVEISLDLDAASAACPRCALLLVETDDQTAADLGSGVDTAARLGATVVSNSYGFPEFTGMNHFAGRYRHRGVSIVAASGDAGFGPPVPFPAVLRNVIAVGGTTLIRDPSEPRGWSESVWSGAGSGCSAYVAKPAWQHDRHCRLRTVADISAVADPNSGFAVYDTYDLGPQAGFILVGGTSLAAPLVAAMIARSGHPLTNASSIYAHPAELYDPRSGSNGYCGNDYLCTGKPGYDAPTGAGTPHGLGAL